MKRTRICSPVISPTCTKDIRAAAVAGLMDLATRSDVDHPAGTHGVDEVEV